MTVSKHWHKAKGISVASLHLLPCIAQPKIYCEVVFQHRICGILGEMRAMDQLTLFSADRNKGINLGRS